MTAQAMEEQQTKRPRFTMTEYRRENLAFLVFITAEYDVAGDIHLLAIFLFHLLEHDQLEPAQTGLRHRLAPELHSPVAVVRFLANYTQYIDLLPWHSSSRIDGIVGLGRAAGSSAACARFVATDHLFAAHNDVRCHRAGMVGHVCSSLRPIFHHLRMVRCRAAQRTCRSGLGAASNYAGSHLEEPWASPRWCFWPHCRASIVA